MFACLFIRICCLIEIEMKKEIDMLSLDSIPGRGEGKLLTFEVSMRYVKNGRYRINSFLNVFVQLVDFDHGKASLFNLNFDSLIL